MGNIPQCSIAMSVESLVYMKYNAEMMQKIWSCLGKYAGSNQSEYAEHEDGHQDFFLKL